MAVTSKRAFGGVISTLRALTGQIGTRQGSLGRPHRGPNRSGAAKGLSQGETSWRELKRRSQIDLRSLAVVCMSSTNNLQTKSHQLCS